MDVLGLLPLLLILVFFYLLILRPARKRQQEALRLQSSLAVGQQVMTTAGLYARVAAVQDDAVVLETAPGVTSRWAKAAVAQVVTQAAGGSAPGEPALDQATWRGDRSGDVPSDVAGDPGDLPRDTTSGGATALGAADAPPADGKPRDRS